MIVATAVPTKRSAQEGSVGDTASTEFMTLAVPPACLCHQPHSLLAHLGAFFSASTFSRAAWCKGEECNDPRSSRASRNRSVWGHEEGERKDGYQRHRGHTAHETQIGKCIGSDARRTGRTDICVTGP